MRLCSLLTVSAAAAAPITPSFTHHLSQAATPSHMPLNPAIPRAQPYSNILDKPAVEPQRIDIHLAVAPTAATLEGFSEQKTRNPYPDFAPHNGTINSHLNRLSLAAEPDVMARDGNNNNFFDWEDLAPVYAAKKVFSDEQFVNFQANGIVEKTLANDAPFILLGEHHNQGGSFNTQPVNLAEKIALQLKEKGYTVRYGMEFSNYELNGYTHNSTLLRDLNAKKITPEEFSDQFVENLSKSYFTKEEKETYTKNELENYLKNDFFVLNMLNSITRLHKAGAEIYGFDPLRDPVYKDKVLDSLPADAEPPTRDAEMANYLTLKHALSPNPNTIDLIATGAFHARKNVDPNYLSMTPPDAAQFITRNNITSNPFASDNFKPLATRLSDRFGDKNVISVNAFPVRTTELEDALGIPADSTLTGEYTAIPGYEFDGITPTTGSWNAENPLPASVLQGYA